MILFPAIDLVQGKAVRLYKGDYDQMTIYSDRPEEIAEDFVRCGCDHIHIVDLEGAKDGGTPNFETVCRIKKNCGAFCEIGGGIRSIETVETYLNAGIDRVILGTAAVENETFLIEALKRYGDKIAVGVDIKNGNVAVKGWLVNSGIGAEEFIFRMQKLGVDTVIVTDISKDGAMSGTNLEMYQSLSKKYSVNIEASGGVSSLEDIKKLREMGLYGAIVGKAYYTGAIDLKAAKEISK